MNNLKSVFLLDENISYLNHGSFGACPKPIFDDLLKWQLQLERNPVQFLDGDLQENIFNSQKSLAEYINCNIDDIVFFQNPTTAMNEVMRSLNLQKIDEILSTNHEYGAMDKAWEFITKKSKAKYIKTEIPTPIESIDKIIELIQSQITDRTKAIFISHITSATGLIFPVEAIVKLAKSNNILSIIDGAHVPGHISLDINNLNPDIYTGTCHKWLLCPKGVSFLYVKKELQDMIDPLVISWGYKNEKIVRTKFQDEHLWQGTRDMSPFLTISKAIEFREKYDWNHISEICHKRIIQFGHEIQTEFGLNPLCSLKDHFLGQFLSFELPNSIHSLDTILNILKQNKIVIPVFEWNNKLLLRISLNGYNNEDDIQKLFNILPRIIKS